MGKTLDEVKAIKKDLRDNVFCKSPYDQLVNGIGISILAMRSSLDPSLDNIVLKQGEDWNDYCIVVLLRTQPTPGLNFPKEYQGVRLSYEIIREIKAR